MAHSIISKSYVDLRQYASIVESQQSIGSCTGNAMTNAYELLTIKEFPEQFVELSRLFIYYNSRKSTTNFLTNDGSTMPDSIIAVDTYGICSENLWPYDTKNVNIRPTAECYADAATRKLKSYQQLSTINEMLSALANGIPIVCGMNVYADFDLLDSQHYTINIDSITGEPIGQHAMCIVGYDANLQVFIVKNSFGTAWGNKGYCNITFNYIISEAFDIWIFEILLS
jgi:C1A family cysteine protease